MFSRFFIFKVFIGSALAEDQTKDPLAANELRIVRSVGEP